MKGGSWCALQVKGDRQGRLRLIKEEDYASPAVNKPPSQLTVE